MGNVSPSGPKLFFVMTHFFVDINFVMAYSGIKIKVGQNKNSSGKETTMKRGNRFRHYAQRLVNSSWDFEEARDNWALYLETARRIMYCGCRARHAHYSY